MLTHPEMERGWRFRQAALPHLNSVYTMARYLTRDTAEAEYAVQECFVRGLRRFDLCSGDGMKPWLLGILRDFCKAELRPRGKALVPPVSDRSDDPASTSELAPSTAPQVTSLCRCGARRVRRLIAELPEEFREPIVLRDIIQLSYRDIAKVLGISTDTLLSRLAAARSELRARLSNRRKSGAMNCSKMEILIHALLDNELDTSHATDVEAHLSTCTACGEELAAFETTRKVVVQADLMEFVPTSLRKRLQLVPSPIVGATVAVAAANSRCLSRRSFAPGLLLAVAVLAAVAATILLASSLPWIIK
jgi:RNA polymerase sigma-70 factor, ECF subfamily